MIFCFLIYDTTIKKFKGKITFKIMYIYEIIIFSDMEPIDTDDQVRNTLSGVEPIDMEHLLRTYVLPCGRDTVYGRK